MEISKLNSTSPWDHLKDLLKANSKLTNSNVVYTTGKEGELRERLSVKIQEGLNRQLMIASKAFCQTKTYQHTHYTNCKSNESTCNQ